MSDRWGMVILTTIDRHHERKRHGDVELNVVNCCDESGIGAGDARRKKTGEKAHGRKAASR